MSCDQSTVNGGRSLCFCSLCWSSFHDFLCHDYMSNIIISKLFQPLSCPSEIILFYCVETCLKLFQNYFRGLLQLTNIFQHVQCCWNNFEIISELFQQLKLFYFSFRRGYMWNETLKEFQNYFISHVTMILDSLQWFRFYCWASNYSQLLHMMLQWYS